MRPPADVTEPDATGALSSLPPAPRDVPWRVAMRARWVLGTIGAPIAVIALAIVPVFTFQGFDALPLRDLALDEGTDRTRADVLAVERTSVHDIGGDYVRVRYSFVPGSDNVAIVDVAMVPPSYRPRPVVGQSLPVEYLPDDPNVSRLVGVRRSSSVLNWLFGLMFGPGVVLTLIWLRAALRLRLLLTEGAATTASVTGYDRLRWVNPNQLRVRYAFDDARRQTRTGTHWIGEGSALGKELLGGRTSTLVIYDPDLPEQSRLVWPPDLA